jgi:flagellar biogenesis protein FliO
MVWSLALVTGLFLIFHWITRKVPQHDRPLPAEVVECLGRGTLSGKQEVQLVRLGSTLLLVAKAAGGPSTLASIDDPEEVERLTTLCKNPERSAEVLVEMLARGRRDRERSRSGAFEGESARA